jgi:SAM-dependent methyltransferase
MEARAEGGTVGPRKVGSYKELLTRHGHQVIGVDSSPDMLARARRRVPDGEFHLAALNQLPLPDDSVDAIVCALAFVHVPGLQPVPGGTEPRLPGTKAIPPLSAVCGTSRHSPGITAAGNALETPWYGWRSAMTAGCGACTTSASVVSCSPGPSNVLRAYRDRPV